MIQRFIRLAVLGFSLVAFFALVGCQSNSNDLNTANKTNSNVGNTSATADNTKNDEQKISALLDEYNEAPKELAKCLACGPLDPVSFD